MLISVGMPLYNEAKYLDQALDSLLAQDYKNFEIIISDNASADKTAAIALTYAKKDPRVKYYRNEKNIGGARNFNRCFELSSGKYFMWASGHDLWARNFLTSCLAAIEKESKAVLAYPLTTLIDARNTSLGIMPGQLSTQSLSPIMRFNALLWSLPNSNPIYGLIKSEMLRETKLMKNVLGTDMLLLAELSLKGEFILVPQPLFFRRETRLEERLVSAKKRRLADSYPDKNKRPILFPYWRLLAKYLAIIIKSSLSWHYKPALFISAFVSLLIIYGRQMRNDLL